MEKVIFIDRDGVINKDSAGWTEYGYITKAEDLHFLPGSKEAIRKLTENGFMVVVISNQASVSKGFCSEEDVEKINAKMLTEIEESGGKITKAYYCLHQSSDNCDCRKPEIGLFEQAGKELGIETKGAFFIGDSERDVKAGKRAGTGTILVLSGKSKKEDVANWGMKPDYIFKDLLEAVEAICQKKL